MLDPPELDKTLIIGSDKKLSWSELGALALGWRDLLHSKSVGPDFVLAVKGETTIHTITLLLGAWSLGATTWLYSTREPSAKVLQLASLIGAREIQGCVSAKHYSKADINAFFEAAIHPKAKSLLNTSGSTGTPKFVEHRIEQHFISAAGVNSFLDFSDTGSWLLSLPIYHVGGLAIWIRALLARAKIILPEPTHSVAESLLLHRVTHLSLVATQLRQLLEMSEARDALKKCIRVVLGGGPLPTWLASVSKEQQIALVASYGATEMASMWTATTGTLDPEKGSGRLLPEREIRINRDSEIGVRGPMLFSRYRGATDLTPFDEDGFYRTGDLGRLDEQENLHIFGRKDNLFISGGENIHPQEIELALLNHPDLVDAVVVSVPHVKWGERPVAFVRQREWSRLSESDLKKYLCPLLAAFKIPDRFFDWPQSQKAMFKPSRRAFREIASDMMRS